MTPQEHKQELKKHRDTPREDQKPCISKVLHLKVVKYRRWFFKNISRIRPVRSKKKNNAWKTRRFHDDCEETRSYLDGHTIIDYFVTRDGTPYFGCLEYEDMWISAATYMRMHAPKGVYFIMTRGLIYEEDCWQGLLLKYRFWLFASPKLDMIEGFDPEETIRIKQEKQK